VPRETIERSGLGGTAPEARLAKILKHGSKGYAPMITNVGKTDRAIRLVLGMALVAVAFFSGLSVFEGGVLKYGAIVVGLVLAVTGLMRTCPAYTLLGIDTCRA